MTSSLPVTHAVLSLSSTAQPGTPQRRVVILPARGNLSPVKVSTSPKRILSPYVFSSSGGNPLPVHTTYTNCGLVDSKCAGAVRTATVSDSVCITSCASPCTSSTSCGGNGESDNRTLSTTLHVDGILTSSSENASRRGIVSVAGRESCVQETSVLSPVISVTSLPVPASSDDNHSVSSGRTVTASSSSGCMYQSSSFVSQASGDKLSGTEVKPANCETSVHRAVALVARPVGSRSQSRAVTVTSVRKACPATDAQKRNVVVKLFAENSSSIDVQPADQCDVMSAGSAKSPKCIVLLRPTGAEHTSDVCSPSVSQRSAENTTSVSITTVCPSLRTVNLVVTSATKAVSTTSRSMTSTRSQTVTEPVMLTVNGSQNSPDAAVDSSKLRTVVAQIPTESSSNVGSESDDDSDDDVVIIDTDIPSSPSRSVAKRSLASQNIILLNHHKSSSPHADDTKRPAPKSAVTDRMEQSRTKRKSALGTRLLEAASDEGIILTASPGFENRSKISQPNRRKSFPQRRTDTSIPQLQFCTKQWKRDVNSRHSTTASSTCKRSQSRSPKKDIGTDSLDKAVRSPRSVLALSQSNLQCSENSSERRKRKTADQCESFTIQEVKRSKRLSPVKSGSTHFNKTVETSDSVVSKDVTVESGIVRTSSADSAKASSDSIPMPVSSCSSDASAAAKTSCDNDEVEVAEPVAESSSELQLLGRDKRSMEMSVTNEDGVVENLVVTIIDISSSEDEEDNDEVEIHLLSSAKLDSSEVLTPEVETSQSVTSKSFISHADGAVKTVQDKLCVNLNTLAPHRRPASKSHETKSVRQKCRQSMRSSSMGRKVVVRQGRAISSAEHADVTKVKQLTQLYGKPNSRKRTKNDASGAVKLTKADTESVSAGYLGPVVRLCGSKDSPTVCSVVSGARDADDETAARLKQKLVMLNSSCYPTSFQLQDSVAWKCVFCHQCSSYRTLGDLFGPYYVKADSAAKSDSVTCQSSPSKCRSRSTKKSPESGCAVVSRNSQGRRQKLQKYVLAVARKSPQKRVTSPDKGIPPEIWLHEDCAVWTSGICLSPTGQLCGLDAAITLSLQTVYLFCCLCLILHSY